jgi:hypothetical protein
MAGDGLANGRLRHANFSILAGRPLRQAAFYLECARMYKVEGSSKKAWQFSAQNYDLQMATENGIIIQIIEVDGWLHVMLDIGQYVSNPSTAIRNAAKLATEWNNRLLKFQGAWSIGGDNQFMERLLSMHEHGKSYNELAKHVNHRVEEYLQEYLAYRAEVDNLYPQFKKDFERDFYYCPFSTEFKHNGSSLSFGQGALKAIGLRDDEIEQELREGLDRMRAGEKPFLPGKPVSQFKITETLRTWREGKKHKAIQSAKKKEKDEFIKKKMNGRKQAEIARIYQRMKKAKQRIEEIGNRMIEAVEESEA